MGRNKKSNVEVLDEFTSTKVTVDSNEEYYIYQWAMECKKLGIIKEYVYQPESFHLTDKFTYVPLFGNVKCKEKHLLQDHIYSADFKFVFDMKYGEKLAQYFKIGQQSVNKDGDIEVWVDVKGTFQRFGGDRSFSINQKLVYDKHKIYVQKITPKECFAILGAPHAARYTIKKKSVSHVFDGYNYIETVFGLKSN